MSRPQPLMPLDAIQREAVAAIRRHLVNPSTSDLRVIAAAFVDARAYFYTRDGDPDWRGRTAAYRRWVREVMGTANVPAAEVATLQAAVRYHTGNLLRERLDPDELADLGLRAEGPRERSIEKRARTAETLDLFGGGAPLDDADDMREAVRLMTLSLRRFRLAALADGERRAVGGGLRELSHDAAELAAEAAGGGEVVV